MIYKIIVDKQPKENPSQDKREYTIDIDELITNGHKSDKLVITFENDYVERWFSLNEYGKLIELLTPVIEPLEDIAIELFPGTNYIYLANENRERFYAQYLLHNDFNDAFITRKETKSLIKQSADEIELSVGSEITRLDGEIEDVNATLELKVGVNDNDQIVSMLNASADEINITGNRLVISSTNFSVTADGTITATAGNIAGFTINSNSFLTHISRTRSGYTQADVTRATGIVMKTITPTQADYDKYDINGDGRIDMADVSLIISIIQAGGSLDFQGTFSIKTDDDQKILEITDETEYESGTRYGTTTRIGLLKSRFKNLLIDYELEFGEKYENSYLRQNKNTIELTHYLPNSHSNDSQIRIYNDIDDLTGQAIGGFEITSKNSSNSWGLIQLLGCTDANSEIDQSKIGYPVANLTYGTDLLQLIPGKINIYQGSTYCYVDSTGVHTSSLAELKKDFEKCENALKEIMNIDIYKYRFNIENDTKKHLGFIIGQDYKYSQMITDDDNRTVDLYSFISLCCKAIQELKQEVDLLKRR